MNQLEKLLAVKLTENGDISFNTTGNNLLDIFFMTAYFEKNLSEVRLGTSEKEKLFARFVRDPRFGLGRRDLGRRLLALADATPEEIVACGRFDDILYIPTDKNLAFFKAQLENGNNLAKKWAPRLTSSSRPIAKALCQIWGMTEKRYRALIKCDTVESKMAGGRFDEIEFETVPSLALLKYYKRFLQDPRFNEYIAKVRAGEKQMHMATTTVYDIYRNREAIDADLFFEKLEKISLSCIPILDTSGSMFDRADSIGKATCIAHYLSKCSSFMPNFVISFSSRPELLEITTAPKRFEENAGRYHWQFGNANNYCKELSSIFTGDCSNTNFAKVLELLQTQKEYPEYFVVLSDMEFDLGAYHTKKETMKLFKEKGVTTKIIWWNFNARNKTVPEFDEYGNIFISGYSPYLLKYMQAGFDGNKFLDALLDAYKQQTLK